MEGWIKLHRKILISNMYRSLNSKQRDVIITCLLLANHEGKEWEWQGKVYKCAPGQFITSLQALCNYCASDVKVQSVRTCLLKLEKWHFLTNKSTKTGRLITICNWDSYQLVDDDTNKDSNKELTKSQQRANKELTTNKNEKNEKNEKNNKEIINTIIWTLNKKTGKEFKTNSKKTITLIKARLKDGFTIDDFQKVIETKTQNWLHDDKMSKYLRPETLFGTKFESYLNETVRNKKPKFIH